MGHCLSMLVPWWNWNPKVSLEDKDQAICAVENVVVYKDKEEAEVRKLRAQWKQKKQAS